MRPIAKLLRNELASEELELVPRSYDVIGSEEKAVAVIEVLEELDDKKVQIAEAVMKLNKSVKSVLNKTSGRKGTYRLEEMELVAGDENTEVVHREHGYLLKMDPRKVFFSPREATERQRIASQVKPEESVLVMFSGCMPYGVCIAKKQPNVNKVYGVEINSDAHHYAKENVRMNKLAHKILLINDDVKNIANHLRMKFDRIVMPIAVGGERYLELALGLAKKGGTVHYYTTGKLDSEVKENVQKLIDAKGNVSHTHKVLPFGVRSWKFCADILSG